MKIEKMFIRKIKEAPFDKKRVPDKELTELIKTLAIRKSYTPIIVNKTTNQVVAGKATLLALYHLNCTYVDVVPVVLSVEEEKAFYDALNHSARVS